MPKKRIKDGTAQQELSRRQKETLLLTPCKTRNELKNWIKYFLGLELPDVTVSRYADTNPLDVIWEVYQITVLKQNPEDIQELLYVAGRGSGKCTLKGTDVLTSEGLKKIENINVGDWVYTGWDWQTVKQTFNEGIKPGVTVTCKNGKYKTPYSLTGSLKHRVQAVDTNGELKWVHMKNLKKGQFIYKSSHDISSRVDINREGYRDGWLIGALVGDGSINRHQSNNIRFCSSDFECLRFYADIVYDKFGVKQQVKRNSKKSVNLSVSNKEFKEWFKDYVDGDLCYDKVLKTLEHDFDFLAGFISGIMDTDGSHDSLTLANHDLINQIGKILNIFGVSCSINNSRRKPRYSEFLNDYIEYSSINFKTKLPDVLLPLFSKRDKFIEHRAKMNEQFRYPNELLKPFARLIKEELGAKNGWITWNGERVRKTIPYAKELFGNLNKSNNFIYGYKIAALRDFFLHLGMHRVAHELNFILDGYFETVNSVVFGDHYFYDLEMNNTHSYWSNGFVSHNTLGMAIAELMVILHDQRDAVHVGAILNQAKRCYEYIVKFLLGDKIRPIVNPNTLAMDKRIVQKMNMEKSIFKIGTDQVSLEVLPCTLKACVDPLAMLKSKKGPVAASELKSGDYVLSLKYDSLSERYAKVIEAKPVYKDCIKIELSNGTYIIGSMDHKVLSYNGWIELKDVNTKTEFFYIDTAIKSNSDYSQKFPKINSQYARSALIGMMLGDASLSLPKKGNPRLYLGHSEKQKDYLYHCKQIIEQIVEVKQIRNKISGYGSKSLELVTASSPELLFLKELFLGPRGKHITKSVIDSIDEIALAYWFMDDGCADSTSYLSTCSFSDIECTDLIDMLKSRFGLVSAKLDKTKHGFNLIRFDTDDTKKLYELIIKHVPASMQYKFLNISTKTVRSLTDGKKVKFSKNGLPRERDTRSHRAWRKKFREAVDHSFVRVVNKTYIGKHQVMQIEVDGDNYTEHSYFANGVLHANCNGPHVPLVVVDEIDTVSGEAVKAFKEIAGMLDSKGGKRALRVGISTRKSMYGLMNQQIENADKENRTVRRWTAFEFTERCPDEKSGKEEELLYIRQDSLEAIPKAQWEKKDPVKQKEYFEQKMYKGCKTCPLAAICLTDAKRQTSKSPMLKTLKELEQKVLGEGADWALAQLMNLKPSLEGIVYKEFDEKDHVFNWNEMWQKLTGEEYPGECTHDMFVKKCHDLEIPCYAGIDWGWSNPSTVVFFFIDKRENVYIVRCEGETFCNDPKWIEKIRTKWHRMYRCQLYFPDIANGSAIDLMKQGGLPVANKQDKSVSLGVQVIKRLLRTPGSQDTKLFIAKETCQQIIDEFLRYHFKIDSAGKVTEDPEKEWDHFLDALRYPLTMLLGKMAVMVTSGPGMDSKKLTDEKGGFYNVPTAAEFAATHGITFNENPEDQSKLGKVGTLSELNDDDDDGQGGDGNFLWSMS